MLQPQWEAAIDSPEIHSLSLQHGSLWFGDYGERHKSHRNETIQMILCETKDFGSLVMLTERERIRLAKLGGDADDQWVLGMKVTGDKHVQLGALSMAVCVEGVHSTPLPAGEVVQLSNEFGDGGAPRGRDGKEHGAILAGYRGVGN